MRVPSIDESSPFLFEKHPQALEWLAFMSPTARDPLLRLHWRFLFLESDLADGDLFERTLLQAAYTLPLTVDDVRELRERFPNLPAMARYNPKFIGRPAAKKAPAREPAREPEAAPSARSAPAQGTTTLRNGRRIILQRGK